MQATRLTMAAEAFQWNGQPHEEWPDWTEHHKAQGGSIWLNGSALTVETASGTRRANKGDWVVRLDDGRLQVLTDENFQKDFDHEGKGWSTAIGDPTEELPDDEQGTVGESPGTHVEGADDDEGQAEPSASKGELATDPENGLGGDSSEAVADDGEGGEDSVSEEDEEAADDLAKLDAKAAAKARKKK